MALSFPAERLNFLQSHTNILNTVCRFKKYKRKEGTVSMIQPVFLKGFLSDVKGINLGISSEEIVDILREIRERSQ